MVESIISQEDLSRRASRHYARLSVDPVWKRDYTGKERSLMASEVSWTLARNEMMDEIHQMLVTLCHKEKVQLAFVDRHL